MIRSLRHERGLSQESLAGLADVDRSYMSSIERGLRNLSVLNIARIAEALDVPVQDLLGPRPVRPWTSSAPVYDDPAMDLPPAAVLPQHPPGHDRDWEPGRYLSLG
jgi:transcriptional regulator with XRE-family HTH domain